MKAIVCPRYGPPEVLQLREVETPSPKDNEVLIKVRAAGIFKGDTELRAFRIPVSFWIPIRLIIGVFRPRNPILGQEIAGEIVAIGKDVTKFKVGDPVFAATPTGGCGYAEYLSMPETAAMAVKPAQISFAEAATVPVGGYNALHFLRKAAIQPGEQVLVFGACGGIGTMAVQIAKAFGAEVTAVDSADKLDTLRSIGADHVIDYRKEDFTDRREGYDVILDVVGRSRYGRSLAALRPGGRYLLANSTALPLIRGLWTNLTRDRKVLFEFATGKAEHLATLKEMIDAGKLKPVLDSTFPLEQAAEAHRYIETGQKNGSVALIPGAEGENA